MSSESASAKMAIVGGEPMRPMPRTAAPAPSRDVICGGGAESARARSGAGREAPGRHAPNGGGDDGGGGGGGGVVLFTNKVR